MSRYYVAIDSERKGPFTVDELRAIPLTSETLVWAQGMLDWLPAAEVPELSPLLPQALPSPLPEAEPPAGQVSRNIRGIRDDFILANPRLPRMAQAICIYVMVVNPAMWLLSNLSCVAFKSWEETTPSANAVTVLELLYGLLRLATAVLLVIGGLQLRALRPGGMTVLKCGFWMNVAFGVMYFFIAIAIVAASDEPTESTPPTAVAFIGILLSVYAVLAFAWEITSLVWLTRHRLPT